MAESKMGPSKTPKRNKASSLLSKEHNEQVFKLLGPRCITVATALVHLRVIHFSSGLSWARKDKDVLCFVKDYSVRNFYFRLYSLKRNSLIWEKSIRAFYALEVTDCLINFDFINDEEAEEMRAIVDAKLAVLKAKREAKFSQEHNIAENPSKKFKFPGNLFSKNPSKTISKRDIGGPIAVEHLNSVRWSPGFSSHDNTYTHNFLGITLSERQSHFEKLNRSASNSVNTDDRNLNVPLPNIIKELGGLAEFSESNCIDDLPPRYSALSIEQPQDWEIDDKETREFIYKFLNRNMDMDDATNEAASNRDTIENSSNNETRSNADSIKSRPLRPPPPPPRASETHIAAEIVNNDVGVKKSILEREQKEEDLIYLLKTALTQRARAFYSDGSEES